MKSLLSVLIFVLYLTTSVSAQTDTLRLENPARKQFFKHQVLPLGLITVGSLLNLGQIKETIHDHTPHTNTTVDNYLQYVPAAQLYLFDVIGFKHLNSVFDQTKYLLISQLASGIIVHTLKNTTKITRPNGAATSFPSGHTTTAFVNATVLFKEFKDTNPWIAYSGFVVATATGCLRMTNDKHWLPDVMVGAGIGILTVNVVYLLEPLKKLQFTTKSKKISFTPVPGYKSLSLACTF
ncbi:MAG TPA: phosphatase PAP2 family protein [Prolixibacteraceae bacterium]|nr:phosphatase PAP2 family protein [Prolixibacteraceae bacterium]